MENEASRRRECVVALRTREKRQDGEVKSKKKEEEEKKGSEMSGRGRSRDNREKSAEERENRRETHEEPRRRRGEKRAAEPAEQLGRFIPDQLHFQPSSEYKRQFNYRGIFKGGSPPLPLVSSLLASPSSPVLLRACLSLPPPPIPLSVDVVPLRRDGDKKTRHTYRHTHVHRSRQHRALGAPTWASLDDII